LANTLASLVGGTPVLIIRIRPELIGGLIVRIGDRVFDTSLLTRLQSLRHQLLTRGSHEIQNRRDRFCIA
jgi:F-type H+-transporting ATPase subunit delta